VQAVFVAAVGLGGGGLHWNFLLVAEGDHLGAAGELLAEFFDAPGGDDLDRGVEGFGGELEAALIVAFAGGTVGVGVGTDFAGDLQTDFADEWAGDAGSEQIDAFVFGLPLHDGEGEVATELFLGIDDAGGFRAAVLGFFQDRLAVLAGLAKIDIDGVDVVALVLEPAEDDGSVKAAGVSEDAGRHGSSEGTGDRGQESGI
jgi:hypothetical protein